jgi:AcrR family transcriptional regulator
MRVVRSRAVTKPSAAGVPGGRKLRERARRCDEVLAEARRLFTTKGYQGTTMAEIAAASELALGTLYQLFPSKDEMLCRLLEDHVDHLIARVRESAETAGDAREQVARIVRAQLALFQDKADLLGLYLAGLIGYDVSLRQSFGRRLDAKYGEYLDMLSAVVRRGIREGVFAARPPRRVAMALAGMINALVRGWLQDRRGSLAAAADDVLALFFFGASPRGAEGRR